jgi:hypothetical protein
LRILVFILGLTTLVLCQGCASGHGSSRSSVPRMLQPDIDHEERAFFYESFFKRAGT